MIVQSFKYAGLPVLFACVSAVACSKTPATETAFVSASLGGGSACSLQSSDVLDVGSMTSGSLPMTWPEGQQALSINCRVTPSGDGFDLQLDASQPGSQGGEITISGHVTTGDANNGGTVTAQFVSQTVGASYLSSDCKVSYQYLGSDIAANQRASGGSFFGHISCPNATNSGSSISGTQTIGPDGGVVNSMCDGEADVLFQNCDQ